LPPKIRGGGGGASAGLIAIVLMVAGGLERKLLAKVLQGSNWQAALDARAPDLSDEKLGQRYIGFGGPCDGPFNPACRVGENPDALLIGDSYARHLVGVLANSQTPAAFMQLTGSGCPPVFDYRPTPRNPGEEVQSASCKIIQPQLKPMLESREHGIKYVLVSSKFSYMAEDKYTFTVSDKQVQASQAKAVEALREMLQTAIRHGKKPVLISATPRNGLNTALCLEKVYFYQQDLAKCDMPVESVSRYYKNQVMWATLEELKDLAPVINLNDFVCDDKVCASTIGGYPLYRDQGHFSNRGSFLLGQQLDLYGLARERADAFEYPAL